MEASYDMTDFAFNNQKLSGPGPGDDKLLVNFHMRPHLDKAASKAEGRPIYKEREYVTIIIPGDKGTTVNRPVWDMDKRRFPMQYQAFKNNQSQDLVGTPLEQVPWITRSQMEELKYFNIRTLEQLVAMPDHQTQKFMGIRTLQQQARDHIERAKQDAPAAALQAALRERDAKLEEQAGALKELMAKVEILTKMAADKEEKKAK